MKIFVIPSSYKSEFNTQSNIFVHEQCEALIKRGHEVVVLDATTRSFKQWGNKTCAVPKIRQEGSVKVYSYWVRGIAKSRLPKLATAQYKHRINRLWKIAVKNEGMPDVIYAHFTFPSAYCAIDISKKYNVPIVTMEHGGMYLNKKVHPYIINQLCRTVNDSDCFFCVSSVQADRIKALTGYDGSLAVVPNMISDIFKYYPAETDGDFTFFSAGNLKTVKRFDLLIDAFCNAFSSDDSVKLRIAGDGDQRDILEEKIKHNGRAHQISLIGRLNREEMLDEYKRCNVFAIASEHESFGIVSREATACGRPVVSTMNGGINDGWSDEFGYLVPLNDVNAYSEALKSAYQNYSSFSQKRISDKTLEYCSQKNVMDIIENLLINAGESHAGE